MQLSFKSVSIEFSSQNIERPSLGLLPSKDTSSHSNADNNLN